MELVEINRVNVFAQRDVYVPIPKELVVARMGQDVFQRRLVRV